MYNHEGGVSLVGPTDHNAGMPGSIGLKGCYNPPVVDLKMGLDVYELHGCTSLAYSQKVIGTTLRYLVYHSSHLFNMKACT